MKQCASFSPDGKKIVYQYDSMKEPITGIYVMDADGKNPVRISNKANVDRDPAWSPDGKWIVFESYRDPTDGTPVDPQTSKSGLYKMTSDGKTEVRLTQYATAASEPAWSPDGKKILFSSVQDGKYQIYIMNADGTNQTRLTKDNSNDAMSSWSPDGKKIVFSSDRGGKNNIYVMNADGSNQVIITHGDWNDGAPSWSPDGKQIVFCSDRDRTGEGDLNEEIYRMQADGTNPVRLTNNPADDRLPRWKP
jgi:TolB protein